MSESPDSQEASDSSYTVVARRYRPRGFAELVGQDHVGRALKNAIETNRVGHAYLFTGARGVGKTSTARIFAKALNDPSGPTATPDSENDIAKAIDSGEDVDVIEIDGASNRGIDEIRSLRANVGVRPSRSRFKIYIIDEVHMLTPRRLQRVVENVGRAAGACEVHFLHDGSGKDSDHGAQSLPAIRFCSGRSLQNCRSGCEKSSLQNRPPQTTRPWNWSPAALPVRCATANHCWNKCSASVMEPSPRIMCMRCWGPPMTCGCTRWLGRWQIVTLPRRFSKWMPPLTPESMPVDWRNNCWAIFAI